MAPGAPYAWFEASAGTQSVERMTPIGRTACCSISSRGVRVSHERSRPRPYASLASVGAIAYLAAIIVFRMRG
jgi:hypothetical protein